MRTHSDVDEEDLQELRAEPWMLEVLKKNPAYVWWGPHEDYMSKRGDGWDCAVILPTWKEFKWDLDDLNECVHFYFSVERESEACAACGKTGYNPATRVLAEAFYAFDQPRGAGWNDKLTEEEVEMLWAARRLWRFKEKPTAEEVNAWQRKGLGHDAINRYMLVEARAKRLGVYGHCEMCKGKGYVYVADAAHVALTLWMLHPRKGCSRGVEVQRIEQEDLPGVLAFLRTAAQRNAERFARVLED